MNETLPDTHRLDRFQWRLYAAAGAGTAFFAGMLLGTWLQRHFRFGPPPASPPASPPDVPKPAG